MTPAELHAQCIQLTAELVVAREQYAALYKTAQAFKEVAEEAVGMLNTLAQLHEKKR